MQTTGLRTLTADDRLMLELALVSAGVKYRVRQVRGALRVVFEGSWQPVADAINLCDLRHATGQAFDRFSFDGNQAFIRYATR